MSHSDRITLQEYIVRALIFQINQLAPLDEFDPILLEFDREHRKLLTLKGINQTLN